MIYYYDDKIGKVLVTLLHRGGDREVYDENCCFGRRTEHGA